MNISTYFLRQADNMPHKNHNHEKHLFRQQASEVDTEDSASSLAPALREVVSEITANISKIIDDKLSPLSYLLQTHREELDTHEKRITEAEGGICALEDTVEPVEGKMRALEKQVHDLTEHIDDLENRGRRKNIHIVGFPEGTEGDNPTHFFESWLPEILNIETKTGRIKLERPLLSTRALHCPASANDPGKISQLSG